MLRKITSWMLSAAMIVALFAGIPLTARAETVGEWTDPGYVADSFAAGDGTVGSPYEIASAGQLALLAKNTIADTSYSAGKYFVLTQNIDLSGLYWNPIRNLLGSFDGRGHIIRNLTINAVTDRQGLFKQVGDNFTIKNLTLEDCSIISTGNEIGCLIGNMQASDANISISNCHVTGSVSGNTSVGGLVGAALCSNQQIVNSSSSCTVTSTSSTPSFAGGLIGYVSSGANNNTISNSFTTGATLGKHNLGGLIGWASGITISNCYSTGTVTASAGYNVGGLVGCGNQFVTVNSSYSAGNVTSGNVDGFPEKIGGVVGGIDNNPSVVSSNSYYNSLNGNGERGILKTLADMQHPDFTDTLNATQSPFPWTTDSGSINGGFPVLVWQTTAPITYAVSIGTLSGGNITANPAVAEAGTTISLTITPEPGKRLKAGTLAYNNGTADTLISGTSFGMPSQNVTVTGEFEDISAEPNLQSAEIRSSGTKIVLTFDKDISDPTGTQGQFSVSVDGSLNPVTSVSSGTLQNVILLTLTTPVTHGQTVKVTYTPGTVKSWDDVLLGAINNQVVTNNVPAALIGTTEYPTLAGALAAATGTDTICLIADITYSSAIKADTKDVTIDLNGFDLIVSGVAEHALQAENGRMLTISDKDQDGGRVSVSSSGAHKFAAYAASGGDIIIEGTLSAAYPGGDNQGIIGAYAIDSGSTIQITGSVSGYSEGIHAVNSANITVNGDISGSYYGAYVAYNGSADITGNVSGSRSLVVEYAGTAEVAGNITGSNCAVEGTTDFGWNPPIIRVTGNVTCNGGAAISASNDADIQVTGNVTGYTVVSGSSSACPDVTINGDITVSTGFGVSVYYGGMVTVNGRILGASPYLKLNDFNVDKNDYVMSGDYLKYSNSTVGDPAPFAANTVNVAIPPGGYTVTIGTLSGGVIMANPTSAVPGTAINLMISPAFGKQLKAGTLKYNDGSDHAITGTSFIMPVDNVTVTAEFEDDLGNQAPVVTSNWSYTTVYFGHDYPYTITVTDAENTSGTKIYSSLDGAGYNIAVSYPGAPGTQNMTLSPLKGILAAGNHTLRYYAQDIAGAVSDTVTLTFMVTDEPTNPGSGGVGSGGTSVDTGTKITVSTTDGSASVTGTLTQTNGGTQVIVKNDAFDKLDAVDKRATINAQVASVTFDKKAMDAIGTTAGSGDVTLTVRQIPASELSTAQQALVGARPVYDFMVIGGGKTISSFNGGHATVGIPYTLAPGEHPHAIVIWHLGDNGKLVGMRGRYDTATKAVVFMTPHFSSFVVGYNPIAFKDVPAGAWYESAVTFLAARDITTGTGDENFSPDAALTRGQFIVMMMRAYGIEPDANPADNFADAGNTYYTNHLASAKRLDISSGVGNNLFAPNREITRQEMFALLYNALTVVGELPEGNSGKKLSDFSDASGIASWAKESLTLLVETGTISGNRDKLSPADNTTRAEMAQALYNLLTQ